MVHMMPNVGERAPEFTLPDQDGQERSLADYRGGFVLLYFYPKDGTPGCTAQACAIRDRFSDFAARGAAVLGVSVDSAASHRKFADKHKLPFTLLSDEEKTVVRRYGVWRKKKFMGKEFDGIVRTSFLIDPEGKIAKVYERVKPATHAEEVLADIEALRA